MRRYLLATTALVAFSAPAQAETISTKTTAPIQTSTVKAGAPDAISITADGSVEVTGGNAVTMDSNHAVANGGKIVVTPGGNANGGAGIVANAGTNGDITNTGTITIDEPYAPTDADNDGDLDGPFAVGSGRYGIRTLGDHTGKLVNSGTITIEGNDSAGISLGGKLTGAFTHDGKTTVIGDRSIGVDAKAIDGNVRLAGSVSAQGKDAIGARFAGDVNGAVVVQGTIASSGYRNTAAPADPSKLDADDLLQGGSALVIEGNVSGGIVLAMPPKDADPNKADEDADGIEDAKEGSARVSSYGSAAAMVVGAADHAITVGPVAGTASGYGLQIEGTVEGLGVYAGVDANGLVVGGRGGAVTVANGIGVSGSVTATSSGANATALRIGSGATTPELRNSGTISASGASAANTQARAVVVDAGAGVATIRNSGAIKAVSGENGGAGAIVDRSGGVNLVENSGTVSATGAKADSGRNVAIDLSANTSGAIVRQTAVAAGVAAPSITGDILLGSGNDTVDLADGTLTGAIKFGAGNNALTLSGDTIQTGTVTFGSGNDAMSLSGGSQFSGVADFGGGVDGLALSGTSVFVGTLVNAANLNVTMNGGKLSVAKLSTIGSLTMGNGSVLVATLNQAAGQGTLFTVGGTASFAQGSKLSLQLADVSTAVGRYTVLTAGNLQGAANLTADTALMPFLFKAAIATNGGPNSIVVDVAKRSVSELGLTGSRAKAYDAVFAALSKDADVGGVFLAITDGDTFRQAVGSMLPDHAGGAFEGISLGTRSLTRQMLDPRGPIAYSDKLSVYVNAGFWDSNKAQGDNAAYDLNGYSWSLMAEYRTKLGAFSAAASYLWNQHSNGTASSVSANAYELAGGWRGTWGGITAFGRASLGTSKFSGRRTFAGSYGGKTVEKKINGSWNGTFTTLAAGISGEGGGSKFFFRPAVSIDYVRLKEDNYTETGGGAALDLTVDSRKSSEVGANAGLTLGIDFFGNEKNADNWLRLETEGGWREILSGGLGATTASFKDGTPFTLTGDDATSGWFARLRMFGGSSGFTVGGELGAEERHDNVGISLRGTMRIGF
jgi:hypothetical protein